MAETDTPQFAWQFCSAAANYVRDDRASLYGDARRNHENIAELWNAYLRCIRERLDKGITARDVALMMALMKIARTTFGRGTPDSYIDLCGYGGIAGAISVQEDGATPRKDSG